MAIWAEMGNYETIDELLDVYGRTDDKQVAESVGMTLPYVQDNIGFSIDFINYSRAMAAYLANQEAYNRYYETIHRRNQQRNAGKIL